MSLKPPFEGNVEDSSNTPDDVPENSSHSALDGSANWPTRPTRSNTRPIIRATKPNRANQAINDAQQGLSALLSNQSPQRGNGDEPEIILPSESGSTASGASGAARNTPRGRVAGPTATPVRNTQPHKVDPVAGYLAQSTGLSSDVAGSSLSTIVEGYEDLDDIQAVPQTRLDLGIARGKEQVEVIRRRAGLLVGPIEGSGSPPDEATQTSRRAAARWATRYATHIVIVFIVGVLVALGGLTGLTQGTIPIHDEYVATDVIEGDNGSGDTKTTLDNQFDITLPRTELNGAAGKNPATGTNPATASAVTKYTVVNGDTIQSVAKAFHVMPETVMGSNGIFDAGQDLTPGETLNIPPVDGMYYVPTQGDTIESIAQRYGVAPEVVSSYGPNNLKAGGLKPGQAIVVPGGMMPQRDVVLVYTVNPGDTLKDIAARFGVDVPTMIYSNDLDDPDSLQIGQELRVLPVSGIEYKVKKGDTLAGIAERAGVSPQTIIDYSPNHLDAGSVLQVDQVLLVPGGKIEQPAIAVNPKTGNSSSSGGSKPKTITSSTGSKPAGGSSKSSSSGSVQKVKPKVEVKPVQSQTKTVTKSAVKSQPAKPVSKPVAKPVSNTPKVGSGRMMWPVRGRITQYFSARHNGLDIAVSAGTPIHAADSGRIIWSGWRTDGLGYCVMIDHGNGLTTIYGHMIRHPPVYVGQYVSKGDIIGNIGSTGRSTGPHVHFMVKAGSGRSYRNPLAYLGK